MNQTETSDTSLCAVGVPAPVDAGAAARVKTSDADAIEGGMTADSAPAAAKPTSVRRWPRRLAVGLAVAYSAALIIVIFALRFIGEAWWLTTAALYLPRWGFALPVPLVAALLVIFGSWRQIAVLLPLPIGLLLFPLMGLCLGTGSALKKAQAAHSARPHLRVLSFNVAAGDFAEATPDTVKAGKADIILLQEWDARVAQRLVPLFPDFHRSVDGQFGVLSRYPITDVFLPSTVPYLETNDRAARYARYRIATPMGQVTVINVHPISPRNGLEKFRRIDLRARLKNGIWGGREGIATLRRNAALRWEQAEAIQAEAARAAGLVIIAGDTNLPGLSRIYANTLASFRDGFAEVGRGFGYTYPVYQPWMRIDRILASAPLTFSRFEVLPAGGSDHLAVAAELILP